MYNQQGETKMNWHQQNAIRRDIALRNVKAHVVDHSRYGFYALCGQRIPQVTVAAEYAHKEHNNTCKKCLKKLDNSN